MDNHLYQIIIGSYGGLLLLVVSLLVRILFDINKRQNEQDKKVDYVSYVVKEIKGEQIPTIRIEIKKLEDRTDDIEHRTDRLEQAVNKPSLLKDKYNG